MYIDAGIVMLMSMMMAIGMRSFYGRGLDGMAYSEYIGRIEIVCVPKNFHIGGLGNGRLDEHRGKYFAR